MGPQLHVYSLPRMLLRYPIAELLTSTLVTMTDLRYELCPKMYGLSP